MAKRVALVVGNSEYKFTAPLKNPVNDAIAVEKQLQNNGFKIVGGSRKGLNLDYKAFSEIVRDFGRSSEEADIVLFFYAGHAIQLNGHNYLLPTDAALGSEGAVHRECVQLSAAVLKEMEKHNRTSLVFLDACRDNPLTKNLARSKGLRAASIGEGLAPTTRHALGTFIAFATQPDHVAYDGEGENGFFTKAFLDNLEQYPTLEIRQIMDRVRVQVYNATQHLDRGPQLPWDHSALMGGFYFAEPQSTLFEPEPVIPVVSLADEEGDAWEIVKNSSDPELMEQFLKKFPTGKYALIVRPKLQNILKEQAEQRRRYELERAEREKREREAALEQEAEEIWEYIQHWSNAETLLEYAKRYEDTSYFFKVREALFGKGIVILKDGGSGEARIYKPGSGKDAWFQDAPFAPEMVVIPPGRFMMGSPEDDEGCHDDESPQHEVSINYPFAVGRFAVTYEQFQHFADTTNYQVPNRTWTYENDKVEERDNRSFRNPGFEQSDIHPVVCVNWHDAQAYIKWLREVTGQSYRLLSEAEWEYVCRAETTTPYCFGSSISNSQANYNLVKSHTVPVDSYEPNGWGLYNVHGNAWEWCEDSWHDSYKGAPQDGSAWVEKGADDSVPRVLRGGSWYGTPQHLRSAYRSNDVPLYRGFYIGFRVSRMLTPLDPYLFTPERERLEKLARLEEDAADEWPQVEQIASIEAYQIFAERYSETVYFTKVRDKLLGKGVVILKDSGSREVHIYKPGSGKDEWFQDAPFAPEMVVIPPGKFMMGSPESEEGRRSNESPQHEVEINYPFAVGRFAVTFEQFRHFADSTNYQVPNRARTYESGKWEERDNLSFRNPGFEQSDTHPVVCVNWHDAQAYIKWLREVTGQPYRLLSESEWEYVCRAGTLTPYWFGSGISNSQANYNFVKGHTVPVDSYEPNGWGLYNVHGNIWEWCEDRWHDSYKGAPQDGSAWVDNELGARIARGGCWYNSPHYFRSAVRSSNNPTNRDYVIGFRVSRTLTP